MRFTSLLAAALAMTLVAGCGGSSGGDDPVVDQQVTLVMGAVTDANGEPLAGVMVEGGGATVRSGADGHYELRANASGPTSFVFSKDGYLTTTRTSPVLDAVPTVADAQLLAEAAPTPLNADEGGEASSARGAMMIAPAGAFVSPDAASVSGEVQVFLTPIDPTIPGEANAVSGRFEARTANGEPALLESFGMLDVTVRQDGQTLQVAEGQHLEIRIPVPDRGEPPATIPLWSFDEGENRWVQEGEATLDADAGVYIGQIGHMSPWNADVVTDATCIKGLVKDAETHGALPGARVTGHGLDYSGSSSATANADGLFLLVVRPNSQISVLASHAAGGGQIREIESGAQPCSIPPREEDCLDVGEWEVQRGVVRFDDGRTVTCAADANPLAGTCAEEMMSIFTCFDGVGDCTYDVSEDFMSTTVRYTNGAAIEMTRDGSGGLIIYRASNGSGCGTGHIGDVEGERYELTPAGGQTFVLDTDPRTDEALITCPSGETVRLTRDDEIQLEACGIGAEMECEDPDFDGLGGGGGVEGMCQHVSDCDYENGQICCLFAADTEGYGICLPMETCQQIIDAQGQN